MSCGVRIRTCFNDVFHKVFSLATASPLTGRSCRSSCARRPHCPWSRSPCWVVCAGGGRVDATKLGGVFNRKVLGQTEGGPGAASSSRGHLLGVGSAGHHQQARGHLQEGRLGHIAMHRNTPEPTCRHDPILQVEPHKP